MYRVYCIWLFIHDYTFYHTRINSRPNWYMAFLRVVPANLLPPFSDYDSRQNKQDVSAPTRLVNVLTRTFDSDLPCLEGLNYSLLN